MGSVRARLAMARSGSVENGPNGMACASFGSIPAVSTNSMPSSSRKLSTQCFAGTRMRLNATSIYRMFRQRSGKQAIGCPSVLGHQLFGRVDGLLEVGPFKSFLRQVQVRLSSSPKKKTV
jgi:hypothetical protein